MKIFWRFIRTLLYFYLGGCMAASWSALVGVYGLATPFLWPLIVGEIWYSVFLKTPPY